MGTNYYAYWTPPQAHGVRVTLHICKSLTSFSGEVFPDWASWKAFLLHGAKTENVTIEDEYRAPYEVDEFVALVEKVPMNRRRDHYDWLVKHGYALDRDWLDPENFSFHNSEFF
jgi:hypothetical protein